MEGGPWEGVKGRKYKDMNRSTRIVKRLLALFLVVLMSINTFAAVVGDNDGAAFITKAEFDSLKNDFQSQIDQYNTSIDSKIDGAIASYLAGISVSKKTSVNTLNSGEWECVSTQYDASDYTWRYKYGAPRIDATVADVGWHNGGSETTALRLTSLQCTYATLPARALADMHFQHKLCLRTINQTNGTGEWAGTSFACHDFIRAITAGSYARFGATLADGDTQHFASPYVPGGEGPWHADDYSNRRILGFVWVRTTNATSFSTEGSFVSQSVVHTWGALKQQKLIIDSNSIPYLNFNRYPEQRNWGFYTTKTDTTSFEKLWTDGLDSWGMAVPSELKNAYGTNGNLLCYDQGSEKTDKSIHSWY